MGKIRDIPQAVNSPIAVAGRTKKWADKTAIANASPTIIHDQHGKEYAIVAIGPIVFADDCEVWERQVEETDKHWEMFTLFRDQDPWSRTKVAVARGLGLDAGNGTPPAINKPATKNRWNERVIAYDAYCDKRMREELFQRKLSARIKTAQIGRRMREKAAEALIALRPIIYVAIKDPETGAITHEKRSALKPGDIAKLAEIGVKLERMALGEDDTPMLPAASINLTQINITTMTDEELLASASKIISAGEGDIIEGSVS